MKNGLVPYESLCGLEESGIFRWDHQTTRSWVFRVGGLVDGSIMLISWILKTVELSLRSTISYMENAKDLWEDIKE